MPKPVSFAYSGNGFCPEARDRLEALGFLYARRGMQPEFPYGKINVGPPYDASKHDRLLIPTTGDAYPDWTFEHFERVVSQAAPGKVVVLQFHGVPDVVHPWVHTPPEAFERYMRHLKDKGYRVIALRDLAPVAKFVAGDPMRKVRYPEVKGALPLPLSEAKPLPVVTGREGRIAPYPGRLHPRIGFLEGAVNPLRGTKAMAFLPWDPESYVVIDVPEAIFAGKQLRFLAHTHIPTHWDERNVIVEDRDWERTAAGGLRSRWVLPDKLKIGATVEPASDGSIAMELSLRNGTPEALRELRSQVCVMFKFARGFAEQSNGNKTFEKSRAIARAGERAVITEWENCGRTWGNALCPCMHSDPSLPDCAPGAEVKVRGRLWFEG